MKRQVLRGLRVQINKIELINSTNRNLKNLMSGPKIYTSQQFKQYQDANQCPRCNQQEDIYIELSCGHKFCILCITFAYLKFRGLLQSKNKIKCIECQKLSQLDEQLHDLIRQIISKQLGPIMKNQAQNNQSRMSINNANLQGSNDSQRIGLKFNFRSEEDFILQNAALTPNNNSKVFYSKCQTPQNSSSDHEDICTVHSNECILYFCLSCRFKPLCYKCVQSKKHSNHDVKNIKKAIEVINERFSLVHLETAQKIQNIELYQKRLHDRKVIFKERIQKSIKQIKAVFLSLEKKILEKSNQIIQQYLSHYQSKIQQIETKFDQNTEMLKKMKSFEQMVRDFLNSNENILCNKNSPHLHAKTIQKYEQIQNKRKNVLESNQDPNLSFNQKHNKLFNFHQTIFSPINYENCELIKSITKITESIENLSFSNFIIQENQNQKTKFNQTIPYTSIMNSDILFNKNKTMTLKNVSSRQKLHRQNNNQFIDQNFAKRIKTNAPVSLNTSREKRQKKPITKTQEDERRLKSKANYKTQTNGQFKNIQKTQKTQNLKEIPVPAYITKHLEKHNMAANGTRKVSPFNNGTVHLIQNLHTSKLASKLVSKTVNVLNNDQFNNRKKNKESFQQEGHKDKKGMIKSAKNSEVVKRKR